jgi:hypothetical protein
LKITLLKLKLDKATYQVGEQVQIGDNQVYEIVSVPKLVMYAYHWEVLYFITGLEFFKEGFEYEVEKI